jgi:hypothetical protein
MTPSQFQVRADRFGNLLAAGGWVLQPKYGTAIEIAAAPDGGPLPPPPEEEPGGIPASRADGATPLGGSGRNLIATGLPAPA